MADMLDQIIDAQGQTQTRFVATRGTNAWHGLGQDAERGDKVRTLAEKIGAMALYVAASLYYAAKGDVETLSDGRIAFYPGQAPDKAILDSRGRYMSTMSRDYQIHQPAQVIETLEAYEETGLMRAKTLGFLDQGRRMFVMFEPTDAQHGQIKDEVFQSFIFGATSFDGTLKTQFGNTGVCIVCSNTLAMALDESGKKRVGVSHRSSLGKDVQAEVRNLLNDNIAATANFVEIGETLADTPVSESERLTTIQYLTNPSWFAKREKDNGAAILRDLIQAEDSRVIVESLLAVANSESGNVYRMNGSIPSINDLSRSGHSILDEIVNGPGANLDARNGTAWGLLNGVTGHVDHKAGRDRDTALSAAWFGPGSKLKDKTLDLLTVMAEVKRS